MTPKEIEDLKNFAASLCGDEETNEQMSQRIDDFLASAERPFAESRFPLRIIEGLLVQNREFKARIVELTTPAPHCQFASYCTKRPTKGDLCEWHVCSKPNCTNPRDRAFHTCEEH
jgi:hypothetical protein